MTSDSSGTTRRGILQRAVIIAGGGVAIAVGLGESAASAEDAKVTQSIAQYQPSPKAGAQRSGCGSFVAPSACKLVVGSISPNGWCLLFNAKT